MADDMGTGTRAAGSPGHAILVAAAAVRQAGTRTAAVAGRLPQQDGAASDPVRALVATFHHVDSGAAAEALRGCFNPRIAGAAAPRDDAAIPNAAFTIRF